MNPRHKPLAWAGAALAAGIAVVLVVRGIGDDAPMSATPAAAPAMPEAAPAMPPSGGMQIAEPAPWERAQPAAAGAAAGARAATARTAVVPEGFDAVAQVATIRAQSQQNLAMLDSLVGEIDALEKSGKASPDMQLGALRQNLGVARRAQVLALELAETTQQPDTPARRQRTDAIVAELQQLQGQLRYDLVPAGLPTPEQAP